MAQSRALSTSRFLYALSTTHRVQCRSYFATHGLQSAEESRLPRVANPSFWWYLIPKPLRRTSDPVEAAERIRRRASGADERRVAAVFFTLAIIVGSNAIQTIALKRQILDFSRKTDAKISLLKEALEKVKNGEEVDVAKLLGTGDPESEKEWEEVVQELEKHDHLWTGRQKRLDKLAENESINKKRRERENEEERKKNELGRANASARGTSEHSQSPDSEPSRSTKTKFLM